MPLTCFTPILNSTYQNCTSTTQSSIQRALKELGIDLPVINTVPKREKPEIFDKANCDNWHMPEKYYQINVLEWLLDKCQNDEEKMRVQMEYDLFEKKQFAATTIPDILH